MTWELHMVACKMLNGLECEMESGMEYWKWIINIFESAFKNILLFFSLNNIIRHSNLLLPSCPHTCSQVSGSFLCWHNSLFTLLNSTLLCMSVLQDRKCFGHKPQKSPEVALNMRGSSWTCSWESPSHCKLEVSTFLFNVIRLQTNSSTYRTNNKLVITIKSYTFAKVKPTTTRASDITSSKQAVLLTNHESTWSWNSVIS